MGSSFSLNELNRSIPVGKGSKLRRAFAFLGPGILVSVGYMDPGNWATDLKGGAMFGYSLLWVILASNLMAIVLQILCARMGIVMERDLAQACRDTYKKPANIALWFLCEIAIIACDVAEVIGAAVALNLLFNINLVTGVLITGFDVLLLLGLSRFGFRKLEAVVIVLVITITVCFGIDLFLAKPDLGAMAKGLIPTSFKNGEQFAIAVGILGATVMPHNLYLHSAIIQTRANERTTEGKRSAVRSATIDTVISLMAAFFVNAAILVLAASVFAPQGLIPEKLEEAHALLKPALGGASATLFAVALLASGQSSTITGTLAGQIVMEGFLQIRVKPWIRRLVTRLLAIIPAIILIVVSNGKSIDLLIVSQIVLSMQLPFAIIPLVMITSDKRRMGDFANPKWLAILAGIISAIITWLNVKLLWDLEQGPMYVVIGGACMLIFGVWVQFFYRPKPASTS